MSAVADAGSFLKGNELGEIWKRVKTNLCSELKGVTSACQENGPRFWRLWSAVNGRQEMKMDATNSWDAEESSVDMAPASPDIEVYI